MNAKLIFCFFFASIFLVGCNQNPDEPTGCTLPPDSFTKSDLVGTWVARQNSRSDTLVIRDDGKYKQSIHLTSPAIDYESEWHTWRIEYTENGLPYLHMDGMRLCAYAPDLIDCEQVGGGNEDQRSFNGGYWYDFCKKKMVLMPNEGVLIVWGVPEQFVQPPRGIVLRLLMYTESGWEYYLEEP